MNLFPFCTKPTEQSLSGRLPKQSVSIVHKLSAKQKTHLHPKSCPPPLPPPPPSYFFSMRDKSSAAAVTVVSLGAGQPLIGHIFQKVRGIHLGNYSTRRFPPLRDNTSKNKMRNIRKHKQPSAKKKKIKKILRTQGNATFRTHAARRAPSPLDVRANKPER